jgi:hypothetical protein
MAEISALKRIQELVEATEMHPAEKELRILCRTSRADGTCTGPFCVLMEFMRLPDLNEAATAASGQDGDPFPIKVRLDRIEEQIGPEWALHVIRDEVELVRSLS